MSPVLALLGTRLLVLTFVGEWRVSSVNSALLLLFVHLLTTFQTQRFLSQHCVGWSVKCHNCLEHCVQDQWLCLLYRLRGRKQQHCQQYRISPDG